MLYQTYVAFPFTKKFYHRGLIPQNLRLFEFHWGLSFNFDIWREQVVEKHFVKKLNIGFPSLLYKMLPPIRKVAFGILKTGYCYLPFHPVYWDSEYTSLQYSKSKYSWICFFISLVLNFLMSAGAAYCIFVHFFIRPREN